MHVQLAVYLVAIATTGVPSAALAPPAPRFQDVAQIDDQRRKPFLVPQSDGTLRYVDDDARFVGIIYENGDVVFHDLPTVRLHLDATTRVGRWFEGMLDAIHRSNSHDRPDLEKHASNPDDPRTRLEEHTEKLPPSPFGALPVLVGVGVNAGSLGVLAPNLEDRRRKQAQREFLEITEPLRDSLARERVDDVERAAMLSLGTELSAIWRDPNLDGARRRRILFDLWDECGERGPTEAEAEARRQERSEHARRRIEAFVRIVAPVESPSAYSLDELDRLNEIRTSRQRFDPYPAKGDQRR